MLRQTVETDIVSYNAVISACEKGQELHRAFGVCAEMLHQAPTPDTVSYRALISASEKGQELRRAFDVCAEMLRQALKPNMFSCRALIGANGGLVRMTVVQYACAFEVGHAEPQSG